MRFEHVYFRRTDLDVTSVFYKKYIFKFNLSTFFCIKSVDIHFTVFLYFKLLSCDFNNCVHSKLF